MRILLFFFCLFHTLAATAQPETLLWRVERLAYRGKYVEAKGVAEQALREYATQPQSKQYALALAATGWIRWHYHRFQEADSLLSAAHTLLEQNQLQKF